MHKRFVLQRDIDVSGVSGCGTVAEGVLFSNGATVIEWTSDTPTSETFRCVEDVAKIHGHGGSTRVVWLD